MSNHTDIHTLLASSQEEWDILDSLIKDNTDFLNLKNKRELSLLQTRAIVQGERYSRSIHKCKKQSDGQENETVLRSLELETKKHELELRKFLDSIENFVTNRSSASLTLSTSSSRSRSTILAEKQAKAEAEKVKVTLAQREAELRKKEAILNEQQALATASAIKEKEH
ncbi:hypothetical protein DPMN_084434 [Dreissena polymorpha]|uniref:Uncharacterized protein n=1 Tax=Dreissena polymorpha TaxID=45954 RepID=A0A9D4BJ91_DREPO|nr:hypothetical protein DPMN_084434 [Dreissena polymorpha]